MQFAPGDRRQKLVFTLVNNSTVIAITDSKLTVDDIERVLKRVRWIRVVDLNPNTTRTVSVLQTVQIVTVELFQSGERL